MNIGMNLNNSIVTLQSSGTLIYSHLNNLPAPARQAGANSQRAACNGSTRSIKRREIAIFRWWQADMDTDTITSIAFWLAIGAGLGLLIDSFLKGMYVPKHWHQVLPAFWVLIGLHIWQKFKNDAGAFLGMITFYALAFMHGFYLMKAGIIYQGYETEINTPDPKPQVIVHPAPNPAGWKLLPNLNQQVVEFPKFDKERRFWIDVLRMYDFDPDTQKYVDLTEQRWVVDKKMFFQKPFANMKLKAEHFGLLKRKGKSKSSKFVVASRVAVALVASGHELPEWNPPAPSR